MFESKLNVTAEDMKGDAAAFTWRQTSSLQFKDYRSTISISEHRNWQQTIFCLSTCISRCRPSVCISSVIPVPVSSSPPSCLRFYLRLSASVQMGCCSSWLHSETSAWWVEVRISLAVSDILTGFTGFLCHCQPVTPHLYKTNRNCLDRLSLSYLSWIV